MTKKFQIFPRSGILLCRTKIKDISIIFFAIIVLAIFLRFYDLSNVPPSASLDEASIGWNAYSIIKTGGDEYGNKFPLLLRAYDDWRPALYVYLVIPFVKMLGLSVLAVRLPSVLLSVAIVIVTYFLVKELFGQEQEFKIQNSKFKITTQNSKVETIAFFSSFLLAISPWHIYISRLGHEVNVGLAFFIFGMLFFVKNKIHISFIFFALSFISYQAEKFFLPIFLIGLFVICRKELLKVKRQVFIGSMISLVFLLPFLQVTFQPNALIRFKATSIFDSQKERYDKQAKLFAKAVENNDLFGKIIYNRRLVPIQIFTEGYIAHFNPRWLFTNPSSDRHKVPSLGLLYLFEAPFILLGLLHLFSKQFNHKVRMLLLLWIIVSPLPGALATDAPHAMRAYTMLPVPQVLAAIGVVSLVSKIFLRSRISLRETNILSLLKLWSNAAKGFADGARASKYLIFALYFLFFIFNFLFFLNNYFSVFPREQSASFQYALSQAISFVVEHEEKYNKIVFSNTDNLYQSYMFFLFHSKYDPRLYHKQGGTKSGGFAQTHQFGKYEFRPIIWSNESKTKSILYVGNPSDFALDEKAIFNGYNLDKTVGVKVVKGKL